jgi:hypothetical protein
MDDEEDVWKVQRGCHRLRKSEKGRRGKGYDKGEGKKM